MNRNIVLRRLAMSIGIVAAILIVLVGAVYFLVDVNQFRPEIQNRLQVSLGRNVELGSLGLSLLPLSVEANGVVIGESDAFPTGRQFAKVRSLAVKANLFALLRGKLDVNSIIVREPEIELVRNSSGEWNWGSIGAKSAPPAGESSEGAPPSLSLSELRIEGASVAVSTLAKAASRTVYGPIDLDVRDFSPSSEFTYDVSLRLPDSGSSVKLTGKAGPFPAGDSTLTPLDAELSASDVKWSSLVRGLQLADSGQFDANANLSAQIHSKDGLLTARGNLAMSGLRVAGRDWPQPVSISFDARDNLRSNVLDVNALDLKSGDVPVHVAGQIRTSPAPATVDLKASLANADLHSLMPLLAVAGASFGEGADLAGRLTTNIHLSGPTDRLAYDGTLDARDFSMKTAGLAQPLKIPALHAAFTPQTIRLDSFRAEAGKTNLEASLELKDYSTKAPQIQFRLTGDSLDVGELQKLTASSGTEKPETETPASSGSSAGALSHWSGNGSIALGRITSDQLEFTQVRTNATLQGGVLKLAPLTATMFNGVHEGSLQVDLRADPPVVTLDSQLKKADVNRVLTATSSMKDRIFGVLVTAIQGKFQAGDASQILKSLNGAVNLDVSDGRLMGFNLLNRLSTVGKFSSFAKQAQEFTAFTALKGRLDIENGVGTTNNLELLFPAGSLAAKGTINLVEQTLNMKVTAVLSKAVSSQVGGSKIGGYLTTALANSNGELVIPALVTGSLSNPHFAPDAVAVASMKVKSLLPSTGKPGALIEGIQGAVSGKESPGRAILDALGAGDSRSRRRRNPDPRGKVPEGLSSRRKPEAPRRPAKGMLLKRT